MSEQGQRIDKTQVQIRIDQQILEINQVICRNIENIDASERGFLSQNILSQLRNFIEHIMLKIWSHPQDIENSYENICQAINFAKSKGDLKFLRRFHDYLQRVVSHYTLDKENSERLMLKYYASLLEIRSFLKKKYNLNVLENLNKFPINTDSGLKEYYEKIAEKLDSHKIYSLAPSRTDRFYIQKIKPFFVNQEIYYEVTFTSTSLNASKFDRVIAFTALNISPFYAAKLSIIEENIAIMGKMMPIFIINEWEVSIRPCEINNFSKIIFDVSLNILSNNAEYKGLMRFLTETGFHLVELIDFPDNEYMLVKQQITNERTTSNFFPVLDCCRELSKNNGNGNNVIRYLLLHLNNKIIKKQADSRRNNLLSNLRLKNGCIPFDKMPFNTSLINHNPKLSDLFECIQSKERTHELFARFIRNNTENQGCLYTPIMDVANFGEITPLISTYNTNLYYRHQERKIVERNNYLYISEYEKNTLFVLHKLKEMTSSGVKNYSNWVVSWLKQNTHPIDCEEKKIALEEMFKQSKVALIYGPAGTGKSTIINHISHLFASNSKLFLANTNPAIDNLKRRVDAANCFFSTIASFIQRKYTSVDYDLLIIDECSTVSNQDMRGILEKAKFKLLILVGDVYQIESILFGNWFSAAQSFIPQTSIFELTKPYRSQNRNLLDLWQSVRNKEDDILEHIARKGYSCRLDTSIFDTSESEEIILCLNYDGLYGINNINRFLQQNNPSPVVPWGVHNYKIGDPILFNESNRFSPLIYNNMKGIITNIEIIDNGNKVQFDIELNKAISGIEADYYDLTLLENSRKNNSIIRFTVNKYKATDEDDDNSASDVVPFQVAYAVSIHKAQGLEYESVKIVITDEIGELITHNIFYTAITRARNKLKIYWSPEVEQKVLAHFNSKVNNRDLVLLKLCDPCLAITTPPKIQQSTTTAP